MPIHYPTPQEIGLHIPRTLRQDRFCRGFDHALRGGQLDRAECFRLSFRMGYRAAKFYLREVRRRRGILEFPLRTRVRMRSIW
jgi:hypothetical protein